MRTATLRNRILKERGVAPAEGGRLRKIPRTNLERLKTDKMKVVEQRLGKTIEEIITSGSCREVAKKYGLDFSTVSRWRKRLGLAGETDDEATAGSGASSNLPE